MNDIEFFIIKKMLLRPLVLAISLVPIFFYKNIENTDFIFYWILTWIVIFLIIINLIKPYKIIGSLNINTKVIKIKLYNKKTFCFYPYQNLNINIEYNGYKGANDNYNILQLPLSVKNGIGIIQIERNKKKYKYNYVANIESKKRLLKFSEAFESFNSKVNINIYK